LPTKFTKCSKWLIMMSSKSSAGTILLWRNNNLKQKIVIIYISKPITYIIARDSFFQLCTMVPVRFKTSIAIISTIDLRTVSVFNYIFLSSSKTSSEIVPNEIHLQLEIPLSHSQYVFIVSTPDKVFFYLFLSTSRNWLDAIL
jgi:hypothetical protein